ncbi:MAG: LAS superfamily LD-carboxypeptidase LdcB [Alteromonadaceae bacterium]|jgi:LAS superfamily LD-carboxypeptidase LdcB
MNIKQLTGQDNAHILMLDEHCGIHKDIEHPWQKMCTAALQDNLVLKIASGYRSFERQLSIWNRKFIGELPIKNQQGQVIDIKTLTNEEKVNAILLFSALPGASRHHWGTDIDIYAENLLPSNEKLQLEPWEYEKEGPFELLSQWLKKHSTEFGFYFPYDKYRQGVAAEPWHLSYQPLASGFLSKLIINELTLVLLNSDIQGKGDIINNIERIYSRYVTNINH